MGIKLNLIASFQNANISFQGVNADYLKIIKFPKLLRSMSDKESKSKKKHTKITQYDVSPSQIQT